MVRIEKRFFKEIDTVKKYLTEECKLNVKEDNNYIYIDSPDKGISERLPIMCAWLLIEWCEPKYKDCFYVLYDYMYTEGIRSIEGIHNSRLRILKIGDIIMDINPKPDKIFYYNKLLYSGEETIPEIYLMLLMDSVEVFYINKPDSITVTYAVCGASMREKYMENVTGMVKIDGLLYYCGDVFKE
jgi:hypothetical protein